MSKKNMNNQEGEQPKKKRRIDKILDEFSPEEFQELANRLQQQNVTAQGKREEDNLQWNKELYSEIMNAE